jgi:hypothetical protein
MSHATAAMSFPGTQVVAGGFCYGDEWLGGESEALKIANRALDHAGRAESMQAPFACVRWGFRVNLTSIIGCIGCCRMKPDELRPNKILRGPLFPEPVQVIVTVPMGDGVKLVGNSAFLFVLTNKGPMPYLFLSSGGSAFTYSPFDTPATASDGVILF